MNTLMKSFSLLACAAGVSLAQGPSFTFDFKDPKGVNAVSFLLDSPLEPIRGLASGVSGAVTFNPQKPEQLTGYLAIAADTLKFPNEKMAEVARTEPWLNVAKYPSITFKARSVSRAMVIQPNVFQLDVKGLFTCKGITQELTVPVRIHYLPDRLGERLDGAQGDLLLVRAEFDIQRVDFNIKPDLGFTEVANKIQIQVAIAGARRKD